MKFTCIECGGHRLEEVMLGVVVASKVNDITIEDGEIFIEYGEQTNDGGHDESYQCQDCGKVIAESQEDLILFFED